MRASHQAQWRCNRLDHSHSSCWWQWIQTTSEMSAPLCPLHSPPQRRVCWIAHHHGNNKNRILELRLYTVIVSHISAVEVNVLYLNGIQGSRCPDQIVTVTTNRLQSGSWRQHCVVEHRIFGSIINNVVSSRELLSQNHFDAWAACHDWRRHSWNITDKEWHAELTQRRHKCRHTNVVKTDGNRCCRVFVLT